MSSTPRTPRPLLAWALGLAVVLTLAGYVGWIWHAASFSNGVAPRPKVLGRVAEVAQRHMWEECTGVTVTPMGTFLVGRHLQHSLNFPFLEHTPNVFGENIKPGHVSPNQRRRRISSLPAVTFVSRLNADGVFELVTWIADSACLHATPDGRRLFLLTALHQAHLSEGTSQPKHPRQLAAYQSDDQGKSWQLRPEGLFPDAGPEPWDLRPKFHDAQNTWGWRDHTVETAVGGVPGALQPSGLQHSADGGTEVTDVLSSEPLVVTVKEAQKRVKAAATWPPGNGPAGSVRRWVEPIDSTHAVAWVSQQFHYWMNGKHSDQFLHLTTRARLNWHDGRWQVSDIERQEGLRLKQVIGRANGQIFAIGTLTDSSPESLLELNKDGMHWDERSALPNVFAPLNAWSVASVRVSDHSLVLSVHSEHAIFGLGTRGQSMLPTHATFYSTDDGTTWKRLALRDQPILGMDARQDHLFWAANSRFSQGDLQVHSYRLTSP